MKTRIDKTEILGTGVDLISLERFRGMILRTPAFIERCFSSCEREQARQEKDPAVFYANCFAAKEACLKAFGVGLFEGVRLVEIEIEPIPQGGFALKQVPAALEQRWRGEKRYLLSVAVSGDLVMANVLIAR